MKKDIIKIIIKVLIYALGLIGTYFGVSAMTSCSASHQIDGYGKTTVITTDTTCVKHFGYLKTR
nr:hypothetical protein RCYEFQYI_RCYEFQYI_CDS_0003 [Microvirus sp.]